MKPFKKERKFGIILFEVILALSIILLITIKFSGITGMVVLEFDDVMLELSNESIFYLDLDNETYSYISFNITGENVFDIELDVLNNAHIDWNYAGELNSTENVGNLSSAISEFLSNCGSFPCNVPFFISSSSPGSIVISDITLVYEESQTNETLVNDTILPGINETPEINMSETVNETIITSEEQFGTTGDFSIFVAPTQGTPTINSTLGTNTTTENVTVYNQSTADSDGNLVKNIINWRLNGSSITLLNMPFEGDTNASNAKDYSDYDTNGTAVSATWSGSSGYDGRGAYTFDGDNDYIDIVSGTFNSNILTISAWIYPVTDVKDSYITNSKTGQLTKHSIIWYPTSGTYNGFACILGSGGSANSASVDSINEWHHVVCQSNTTDMSLYVDGLFIDSSPLGTPSTSTGIIIGASTAVANHFNGTIDDFHVYNIALTPEQINASFGNRTDRIVSAETIIGQNWSACITPNDGTSDGLIACSENLSIIAAPADLVPPVFDEIPPNTTFEYYVDKANSTINFSDDSGIDNFSINDSTYFKVIDTSGITNSSTLPVGEYHINLTVNDTSGNRNSTVLNYTVADTLAPSFDEIPNNLSLSYKQNAVYIDVNASDHSAVDTYFINDTTNFNITLDGVVRNKTLLSEGGDYYLNISANDTYANTELIVVNIYIGTSLQSPNVTNFLVDYGTTNFSLVSDLNSVTNLTLVNQFGKIQFPSSYGVNVSYENYDTNIYMGQNYVTVNTSALNTTFNATSNVTIKNIYCNATIYYVEEEMHTDANSLKLNGSDCEATGVCYNKTCINNNLTFTVQHFTGFALGNASLVVWDETETDGKPFSGQTKYGNQSIKFYANYTNSTGEIWNANCTINFTDIDLYRNMTWNGSSSLFEYNRSFNASGTYTWNSTCNQTFFDDLIATDTVVVTSSVTTCGDVITANRTLSNNLVNCAGNGINFGADLIELNCMQYNISGQGSGYGINITGFGNITVKNCTIFSFDKAVYLENTSYNAIGLSNISNSTIGIYLKNTSNTTITSNYIINNTIGVNFTISDDNYVYDNFFNNTNNAYDNGNNNWNTSKEDVSNILGGDYVGGNFWQDYNGTDTNTDAIGDTLIPYNSTNNIQTGGDSLPLLVPVTCGGIINYNYNLSNDFTCSGTDGLIINASNITINCKDYMIRGDTNTNIGINITGFDNITLKNCTITNFSIGILFNSSHNNTITLNKILNNTIGVNLSNSNDNLIYDNQFNNTNNAYDNGNNKWNISKTLGRNIMGELTVGGNWWHDYAGTDSDTDGLGDTLTPYNSSDNIQGSGGDYLPIVNTIRGDDLRGTTTLTEDIINCPLSGSCLPIIKESNILVDCNGYKIRGGGSGYGISVDPGLLKKEGGDYSYSKTLSNITIKNCVLDNFDKGVFITSRARTSAHARCFWRRCREEDDNYEREVHIENVIIINTTFVNSTDAIYFQADASYDKSVKKYCPGTHTCRSNAEAELTILTIHNNTLKNISQKGVYMKGDIDRNIAYLRHTSIKNNYFENISSGIYADQYTVNHTIYNTTIIKPTNYGIYLNAPSGGVNLTIGTIRGAGAGSSGIRILSATDLDIIDYNITHTGAGGVNLTGTTAFSGAMRNNYFENISAGIYAEKYTGNITNTTIVKPTTYGIYVGASSGLVNLTPTYIQGDLSVSDKSIGIFLSDVTGAEIFYSNFSGLNQSIWFNKSISNSLIESNNFTANNYSIYLCSDCGSTKIIGNNFSYSRTQDITIFSGNNQIVNNTIFINDSPGYTDAIYISGGDNNKIINNNITLALDVAIRSGIYIFGTSTDNNITGNNLLGRNTSVSGIGDGFSTGINISSGNSRNRISNNTIINASIGIDTDAPYTIIDSNFIEGMQSYGIRILGSADNSVIINNVLNTTKANVYSGIGKKITTTSPLVNLTIKNNKLQSPSGNIGYQTYQKGIYLKHGSGHGSNYTIINNTINNATACINLDEVINSTIINNTLIGCGHTADGDLWSEAISLTDSNNIIKYNNITDGVVGISLYPNHKENNTIISNNTIDNTRIGIYLFGYSPGGVRLKDNIITNNTITNSSYGIYMDSGYGNNISSNIIHNDSVAGIYITRRSRNNSIVDNKISDAVIGIHDDGSNDDFGKAGNNTISSNKIYNTTTGIKITNDESIDNIYANNLIHNTSIGINISTNASDHRFINITINDSRIAIYLSSADNINFSNITFGDHQIPFVAEDSMNFSVGNTSMPAGMILRNTSYAEINFSQPIIFNESIRFSKFITLRNNYILVNTSPVNESIGETRGVYFNVSSVMIINSSNLTSVPRVEVRTNYTESYFFCNTTSEPVCYNLSSDINQVKFNSTHFSEFRLEGNSPPTVTNVIINTTSNNNFSTANLTCYANSTDLNPAEVTYSGYWYKNGIKQNPFWNNTAGEANADRGYAVAVDTHDNIVVTGRTAIGAGGRDIWIIKYDYQGNHQWNVTVGSSSDEEGFGIATDSYDDVYVTGYLDEAGNDDIYLLKYNSTGSYQWNKTYDSSGLSDRGQAVAIDGDDNVVVAGFVDNADYYLIKYDSSGNHLWNKTVDTGNVDKAYGVAVDGSNNIIITGYADSNADIYTIKYDSSGNHQWNITSGETGTDVGRGVAIDTQDNVIVAGYIGTDIYTIKYNSTGSYQWNKTDDSGGTDYGYGIAIDSQNNTYTIGYIATGTNDYWILKYNSSGTLISNLTLGGTSTDIGWGIAIDSHDKVIVAGSTSSYGSGGSDFWTVKNPNMTLDISSGPYSDIVTLRNIENLSSDYTNAGENWSCQVRAYDGQLYSQYVIGNNVTIFQDPFVVAPNVTLFLPLNTTSTSNQTINFTCNATDNLALMNITLYIWNSTGEWNVTNSTFNGTSNFSSWNVNDFLPGSYKWNCLAYDNTSNYNWSIVNRTFEIFSTYATSLQCENNSQWIDCTKLNYTNILTRMRVNCTDFQGNTIVNATFNLTNIEDDDQKVYANATSNETDWWILDHEDVLIRDAGEWNASAICHSNLPATYSNSTNWSLSYGSLTAKVVTNHSYVFSNETFVYQAQLTCVGGECADVNATLDPQKVPDEFSIGSNSSFCSNPSNFYCMTGTYDDCISSGSVCDGSDDCGNNVDENSCGAGQCFPGQYACDEGGAPECIDASLICDGNYDCPTAVNDESACGALPTIPAADEDTDGVPDINDSLLNNVSDVTVVGVNSFNITINGTWNESPTGNNSVRFLAGSDIIMDFFYNFSASNKLNLSNVTVNRTGIQDIYVQGLEGVQKSFYLNATGFTGICVKNAGSIIVSPSNCNGTGEFLISEKRCDGSTFDINGKDVICNLQNDVYNITGLTSSGGEAMNKGVIPMNAGFPFYTTNTNPHICTNLSAGDICTPSWYVNATGMTYNTWTFFVDFNATTSLSVGNATTDRVNITIIPANASLIIWDGSDAGMPYGGLSFDTLEEVRFFANYTNKTSNTGIVGANCTVWYDDTEEWTNMTWNVTSEFYQHSKSFSIYGTHIWNVTCNKSGTGYNQITKNNSIYINSVAPNVTLNLPADLASNIGTDNITFNFSVVYDPSMGIKNCSLWDNTTGTWKLNQTIDSLAQIYSNSSFLANPKAVKVSGNYSYIADYDNNSIFVMNITDKDNIVEVGYLKNATSLEGAFQLFISGDYLYVASFTSDAITIVNVTDKRNPKQVGTYDNVSSLNAVSSIYVLGDYAYLGSDASQTLTMVNVLDKHNPVQTASINIGVGGLISDVSSVHTITSGAYEYAYVAIGDLGVGSNYYGFKTYNVTNKTNIGYLSGYDYGSQQGVFALTIDGNYLYLTRPLKGTLDIFDISNVQSPSLTGTVTSNYLNYSYSVKASGNYAYVVSNINDSFTIINVTDKTSPQVVNYLVNTTSLEGATSIDVANDYAYIVADDAKSFTVLDLNYIKNNTIVNFDTNNFSTGHYNWNVQCFDNFTSSLSDWGDSNRTLIIQAPATAPVLNTIVLNSTSPTNNYTIHNLTCYASATDANGDNLTYFGEWYRNGSVFVDKIWNDTFDSGSALDYAYAIAIDSSGNVYVTGKYTNSGKGSDIYTIKYNSNGQHLLNKTYNHSNIVSNSLDVAEDIAVDSSGNIYLTGYTNLNTNDYLTIKYDSNFNLLWNVTFNGGNENDRAYGVAVDSSSNVYVTGTYHNGVNNDAYTIKYNSAGTHQWNKTFDNGGNEQGRDIAVDSSDNIYVASESNTDFYIIKYNSSGDHQWNISSDNGGTETSKEIILDSSDNIYVAGLSYIADQDYFIVKYDSSGNHVWNVSFDSGTHDWAESIDVDSVGNVYVTGYYNNGSNNNYYTMKYNSTGSYIWNVSFDGKASDDRARGIVVDSFGGIYITGYTAPGSESDYHTVKYQDGFIKPNITQGVLTEVANLSSVFTTEGDNWSCKVNAYDGGLYSGFSMSSNLTIQSQDIIQPNATLISPVNAFSTESSSTTFTCNATDNTALINLTLYVYDSTDAVFHKNSSNVTGISNSSSWTIPGFTDGTYKWNCLAYDSAGNYNWSIVNRTLTKTTTTTDDPTGCFLAGTMISLANGSVKPIELIEIGEEVKTQNGTGTVVKTFIHNVSKYMIINDFLEVTPNHPIMINNEWKEAGSIKIGDSLKSINNSEIIVENIEYFDEDVEVFNLEVSSSHTYFAEEVLVHNKGPTDDPDPDPEDPDPDCDDCGQVIFPTIEISDPMSINNLHFIFTNSQNYTNLTFVIEQYGTVEKPSLLHIRKVFGWDFINLMGWITKNEILDSDLLHVKVPQPKKFLDLQGNDEIDVDFDVFIPLTTSSEIYLKFKVFSDSTVVYEEIVPIKVNISEFQVITQPHEDENLVDLYLIISNREDIDKTYSVEFDINSKPDLDYQPTSSILGFFTSMFKGPKTVSLEWYGPYDVKANDAVMFAYQYEYVDDFAGRYNLKYSLYDERGRKINEISEEVNLTRKGMKIIEEVTPEELPPVVEKPERITLLKEMGYAFKGIGSMVASIFDSIENFIRNTYIPFSKSVIAKTIDAVKNITGTGASIFKAIVKIINSLVNPVIDFVNQTYIPFVKAVFAGSLQTIKEISPGLANLIQTTFKTLWNATGLTYDSISTFVIESYLPFVKEITADTIDILEQLVPSLVDVAKSAVKDSIEIFKSSYSTVAEFVKETYLPFVKETISGSLATIEEIMPRVGRFIQSSLESIFSIIKSAVSLVLNTISSTIELSLELITSSYSTITEFVKETYLPFVKEIVSGSLSTIEEIIPALENILESTVKDSLEIFKSSYSTAAEFVKESYLPFVKETVSESLQTIEEIMPGVGRFIQSSLESIFSIIKSAVSFILNTISSTIELSLELITSSYETIVKFIKETYAPAVLDIIVKAGTTVKQNIAMFLYSITIVNVVLTGIFTYKNYNRTLIYHKYEELKRRLARRRRKRKLEEIKELKSRKIAEARKLKLEKIFEKKKLRGKRRIERKEELIEKRKLKQEAKEQEKQQAVEKKKITKEKAIERKHLIQESIENNKQVLNKYLKYSFSKGMTLNQIKKSLISQGWPKKFVSDYCKKYFDKNKVRIISTKKVVGVEKEKSFIDAQLKKLNEDLTGLR